MMNGQSHRARLNLKVRDDGGQSYDIGKKAEEEGFESHQESSSSRGSRGVRAIGVGRGGGVIGSRGRGRPSTSRTYVNFKALLPDSSRARA